MQFCTAGVSRCNGQLGIGTHDTILRCTWRHLSLPPCLIIILLRAGTLRIKVGRSAGRAAVAVRRVARLPLNRHPTAANPKETAIALVAPRPATPTEAAGPSTNDDLARAWADLAASHSCTGTVDAVALNRLLLATRQQACAAANCLYTPVFRAWAPLEKPLAAATGAALCFAELARTAERGLSRRSPSELSELALLLRPMVLQRSAVRRHATTLLDTCIVECSRRAGSDGPRTALAFGPVVALCAGLAATATASAAAEHLRALYARARAAAEMEEGDAFAFEEVRTRGRLVSLPGCCRRLQPSLPSPKAPVLTSCPSRAPPSRQDVRLHRTKGQDSLTARKAAAGRAVTRFLLAHSEALDAAARQQAEAVLPGTTWCCTDDAGLIEASGVSFTPVGAALALREAAARRTIACRALRAVPCA